MRLSPGRYTLQVRRGDGPAGVQRGDGGDVRLEVDGGRATFTVVAFEDVYFWWRGPLERAGVRLLPDKPQQREPRPQRAAPVRARGRALTDVGG